MQLNLEADLGILIYRKTVLKMFLINLQLKKNRPKVVKIKKKTIT